MKSYSILFAVLLTVCSCKQAETTNPIATKVEATTKSVTSAESSVTSTTTTKEMLTEAADEMKSTVDEASTAAEKAVAKVMDDMKEVTATKAAQKTATVGEVAKEMTASKEDMMDKKEDAAMQAEKMVKEKEMELKSASSASDKMAAHATDTPPSKKDQPMPAKDEMKKDHPKAAAVAGPDHGKFDAILRKYVANNGDVNYAGIKSNQAGLNAYLGELESADISTMSRKEKLAYWINVYNAYTIKLITDNYPLGSITDLESGKPWDKKWIKLNGQTLSLNNVENDIIRPQFNEPRIHFAVNCAAKSCPPLLNRAWTAKNMEANFEKQTKAFVNSSSFNQIGGSSATVSKIFEWYAVDFGDLITFLNKYSSTKLDAGASISYKDYNWSLNKS